jgi:two-component system sensor histidine kinase AlgZ
MSQKSSVNTSANDGTAFIPDLCQVQAVLRIVMATELGALLFTLIHSGPATFDWQFLALTSLFMLWIALTSAAVLCSCRHWLARRRTSSQARWAYLLVIAVTVIYALCAELVRLQVWTQADFAWLQQLHVRFLLYCGIISAILGGVVLRYLYLQHLGTQQEKASLEARVQALQARIRPHFLFNSMNSIAGLIPIDPQQAEDAIIDLSELFRSALKPAVNLLPLRTELEVCERYLRIEKLRLGERLTIQRDINPASERVLLPPLCLQPLLENAIYHGIQPRPDGGVLGMRVYEQKQCLYIEVTNPLPTPAADEFTGATARMRKEHHSHNGNQVALANIRSRLQAFYGDRAALKTSQQDRQFTAVLRIPLQEDRDEPSRIHS